MTRRAYIKMCLNYAPRWDYTGIHEIELRLELTFDNILIKRFGRM